MLASMYVNAVVAVMWVIQHSGYLEMLFSLFKRERVSGADQDLDSRAEITAGIWGRAYMIGWMIFWFNQFNSIDGIWQYMFVRRQAII